MALSTGERSRVLCQEISGLKMGAVLANPFFIYIYAFVFIFGLYSLGWSGLFPQIQFSTAAFFLTTFCAALVLGIWTNKHKLVRYAKVDYGKIVRAGTILVYLILFVEIVYNRAIPLLKIASGQAYDFHDFTFPLLHHFLTTLPPFLATIAFHSFLSTRKKTYFMYCLLNVIPSILLFHRSVVVIIFINCIFVFLLSGGLRSIKKFLTVVTLLLVFAYLFGVAGNVRTKSAIGNEKEFLVTALMKGTDAKPEAYDSNITQSFYWFYLYASSPLANLQKTVDRSAKYGLSADNAIDFFLQEVCPDIVAKRISAIAGRDEELKSKLVRIIYFLTVGTIYADSYVYLGWLGPMLMFAYLSVIVLAYLLLTRNNIFGVAGIATLSTMVTLSIFSNMIVYTPLSMQLIYPLLLPSLSRFLTMVPQEV